MSEDDRKKYLEELMQPHIPLRVLQEIRQEIVDNALTGIHHGAWISIDDALAIMDRHIKEIEG